MHIGRSYIFIGSRNRKCLSSKTENEVPLGKDWKEAFLGTADTWTEMESVGLRGFKEPEKEGISVPE